MIKRSAFFVALLIGLFLGGTVYALQISQIQFDLYLSAGGAATHTFQVRNPDAQPQEITVYLGDWVRTVEGAHDFLPPKGARWLFPRSFAAGEEMEILYRVAIPLTALSVSGGYITSSPSMRGQIVGEPTLSPTLVGQAPPPAPPPATDALVRITREIIDATPAGDHVTVRLHVHILQEIAGLRIDEIFSASAQVESLDPAGGEFETVNRSNSDWITVTPLRFTIGAGEVQEITFQIQVPFGKTGTHWGMIFVSGSPRPQERGGATVLAVQRFGVKVYTTIRGTERLSGQILRVRKGSHDPLTFSVSFENTGNVQLWPTGKINVINLYGEIVRSLQIEEFPLLPERVRVLTVVDPAGRPLPPGIYRAIVMIDYGGDTIAGGTRDFRIR